MFYISKTKTCLKKIFVFNLYSSSPTNEFFKDSLYIINMYIQGVIASCTNILTTSYWLHVELGKNIYVKILCQNSGSAAEMACKRKHSKYSSIISSNYVFKGLAFETLGPWCKEAIDFINVIGNRLIAESGDSKSKKFLFERISLAIQRGNAASIRGTFPDSAILSEIFVL
jgi:hypothetical protein